MAHAGSSPHAALVESGVDGSETCHDGNTANGDGCSSACAVEGGFGCFGEPSTCGTLVTATNSPALAIPDNNATGVTGSSANPAWS